jgi:hypothetical protein
MTNIDNETDYTIGNIRAVCFLKGVPFLFVTAK